MMVGPKSSVDKGGGLQKQTSTQAAAEVIRADKRLITQIPRSRTRREQQRAARSKRPEARATAAAEHDGSKAIERPSNKKRQKSRKSKKQSESLKRKQLKAVVRILRGGNEH